MVKLEDGKKQKFPSNNTFIGQKKQVGVKNNLLSVESQMILGRTEISRKQNHMEKKTKKLRIAARSDLDISRSRQKTRPNCSAGKHIRREANDFCK